MINGLLPFAFNSKGFLVKSASIICAKELTFPDDFE